MTFWVVSSIFNNSFITAEEYDLYDTTLFTQNNLINNFLKYPDILWHSLYNDYVSTYFVVKAFLVGLGERLFHVTLWILGEKHCRPRPGRVGEGEEHTGGQIGRLRCNGGSWWTIRVESGLLVSNCSACKQKFIQSLLEDRWLCTTNVHVYKSKYHFHIS